MPDSNVGEQGLRVSRVSSISFFYQSSSLVRMRSDPIRQNYGHVSSPSVKVEACIEGDRVGNELYDFADL